MSEELKNYRIIRVNEFTELESTEVKAYSKKEALEIAIKNDNWDREEEKFLVIKEAQKMEALS